MDTQGFLNALGPIGGGIIGAAIAGIVATSVAFYNNSVSRTKSQNEWRRDKVLSLILEFQDEMRRIDDGLFTYAYDLMSKDIEKKSNALFAIHRESYNNQYYKQVRIIGQKLELLISPEFRSSFNEQLNQFINNDADYYAEIIMGTFTNPRPDESLPERHNFQPLFLEILDNLR
ncbi:hypothetical protein [Serratia quinivorans]|uniref:hypothetical protein n=1 Tax=Serratia quinivorans TaxID=137545 RepID=UPI0021BD0261|nr:hypothetical protein [Serratia quinivorans]